MADNENVHAEALKAFIKQTDTSTFPMTKKKHLTKSRFKLACECPTKLFYTRKIEYANQKQEDDFLKALAEVEISMSNLIESGKVQDAMNDASKSLFEALVLTKQEQEAGVVLMQSVLNVRLNFLASQLVLVEKTGF